MCVRVIVCMSVYICHRLSSRLSSHPSMPTKTLPACQQQMRDLTMACIIVITRSRVMLCINSPAFFDITLMASFSMQSRDTYALVKQFNTKTDHRFCFFYTTKVPLYC